MELCHVPYEDRILDVKLVDGLSGSVTVTIEEDLQRWRLLFLAFGIMLLLVAPIVSSWVPFYYSSSMAIGVCLVIIVLLFQGMKLLPTGRKNIFYLTIYGSVLGAGSVLVHQFSMLINSIVSNFGLSEEFHNPVAVFILVGIILAGAGLGYWLVRKFVISDDGNVDVGVAQFVKWAIRIIGITFIFQSTLDSPLVFLVLSSWWLICFAITSMQRHASRDLSYSGIGDVWAKSSKQINMNKNVLSSLANPESLVRLEFHTVARAHLHGLILLSKDFQMAKVKKWANTIQLFTRHRTERDSRQRSGKISHKSLPRSCC